MKYRSNRSNLEKLESRTLLSSTVISGSGITGEYFIGDNFQTPVVVRNDPRINFDYASGLPDQDIPAGVFTARWAGNIQAPSTATFTFYTNANSGTRVIVDGTTIIDNFTSRTNSLSQGNIALTAGQQYSIEVDYVSRGKGPAKMQLLWSGGINKKQVVPKSALYSDTTVTLPSAPLLGTYYLGGDFQKQVMSRADTKINFNWDTGSPDPSIPTHTPFSVRWTGQITAPVDGNYVFQTVTDDGARLFINSSEVIKDWTVHPAKSNFAKVPLVAGQTYFITMEYFQNGAGHTSAQLLWTVPGTHDKVQVVPFTTGTPVTAPDAPGNVTATALSATAIRVTWSDVVGETGFIIQRSTDGVNFTELATQVQGDLAYEDDAVSSGTTYYYNVIATDNGVNSPVSLPANATTPTLNGTPTAVVATAALSGTTATITWTSSPAATSFLVERSPDGSTGWTTLGTTTANSLNDTGLASATTYYYRVTPSNAQGSGTPSNVVNVTTVTDAPIGLTAHAVSDTQINLAWNDVTGETGFIVQESPDGSTGWTQIGTTTTGVTTFPAAGLASNTQYFFRVLAVDAGGDSAPSNVASDTTNAAVPAYAQLTALYGLTTSGKAYSIDPTTGATTQIGTLSFGTNAGGRDPISGDFFYVSTGTSNVEIASWDPTDDTNHVINTSVPVGFSVAQAAFRDNGQFFLATGQGNLYAINSTTGVGTLKGNIHANGSTLSLNNGDMAFGPDGTLYIETNSELYSATRAAVNAATGSGSIITATDLGPTGTNNLQIAFGQNGILFGQDSNGQLYTLSTTDGAGTAVGSPSGIGMNDLASTPLYADLMTGQTASTFTRGSNGTYTLTVNNAGPDATTGPITLVDTLDTGITFISGSGNGWTFSQSGQTVTMTYTGSIASGATTPAITLTVGVGSGAGNTVTNTVTVNATVFDTNTANNTSTLGSMVTG